MTFPVDDVTLAIVEAACSPDDGRSHLQDVLEQPEDTRWACVCLEDLGLLDATECRRHIAGWHPNDVILALIAEVRRLREAL